jgi:chromosomal replication initiation ATPase DnaA
MLPPQKNASLMLILQFNVDFNMNRFLLGHFSLSLSEEVVQYPIDHYSRNIGDLFVALEKLDHTSLIAKRRITIPFIKSVLIAPY